MKEAVLQPFIFTGESNHDRCRLAMAGDQYLFALSISNDALKIVLRLSQW